uniref:Putative fructokinase-1 n=1 Tax=Davidia involucrata TaxID=16924 RepID=A0A5B7AXN8_DAVIN
MLTSVGIKDVDVATLGDICVDIVLNVPKLPPASLEERKAYMEQLSKSPPDKQYWEAGGSCNMAIAAARLGLCCITIGHVGNEIYGRFLLDVLHDEGIDMVGMCEDNDVVNGFSAAFETLLCWVLVDPLQRHGFCSRADFSKEPTFSWMSKLSNEIKMAIKKSKILFCDGYVFGDLAPGLIVSALEYAVEVGTSVFFDPGPRGKSLSVGTPEEQRALGKLLRMSDVLLLTSEEAESLTGIGNPILAGQELLKEGVRTKWVIVKMGPKGSILITTSSISCAPAFKVNVVDTVGCGDSFAAAIAFGFIHNVPMVYTLTIANAVGAATAMGCGAGRNVATLKQVIELMKAENLNEDENFWKELLDENLDAQEITFLSKMVINGINNQLNCVSPQKVVSEVLPKLESARVKGVVPS